MTGLLIALVVLQALSLLVSLAATGHLGILVKLHQSQPQQPFLYDIPQSSRVN